MANVIRVALSGFNAVTDSDIRHFSLYSDDDNVLIKEHSRGTVTDLDDAQTSTITHSLGYSPHCYVYGETSTNGRFQLVTGYNLFGDWRMLTNDDDLEIDNNTGTDNRDIRYFIFYDNID